MAPLTSAERAVRVTLEFESDAGRRYLYDDVTGAILPWDDGREAALQAALAADPNAAELAAEKGESPMVADVAARLVQRWRALYGAFARDPSQPVPSAQPTDLERWVRENSYALVLVVTEDCNLRCRYCILSERYPLNRRRTTRRMSHETTRRALDWYADLIGEQRSRNPRKRFALSFYGGDPMMNMDLVEDILDDAATRYPGWFVPVMTTNGTLLTPSHTRVLVEHDVMLAVSIDGPRAEHDRLRVDGRGAPTFDRIAKNLRRLRTQHPEYWQSRVTCVSVFDWGTDVEAVERFFAEHADILPRSAFVTPVSPRNTSWYEQYQGSDAERCEAALGRLRQRYKRSLIDGTASSGYLGTLAGLPLLHAVLRRRLLDARPAYLPWTGSCVPGHKVAVNVDGRLDMCERVNGRYPIGHLDEGGIDWERVAQIIARYVREANGACARCPATRLCSSCFALAETDRGFESAEGSCAAIVTDAALRLADYVSIMEANPAARLTFESDTTALEERLLLGC